jgi:hypothetical protein
MYLNWYNFSASCFFNWLGRAFNWSFRILQKLGIGPNVFYIATVVILLAIWLFIAMPKYDKQAKDKGLID